MTDNIPKICAAFEMWQNNDCIKAGTTLELVMRYLADDPEIDVVVSSDDQDRAYRDYIGRQNENLNTKTMIIRGLNIQVAQLKSEQTNDEDCIGCAGPCKVVDVAAKLQKELDDTMGQLVDSRKRCDHLSTQIGYLQNELGSAQNMYLASSDECYKQRKIIGDYRETIQLERIDHAATLKTVNQYHHAKIKDLKNFLPDNFWAVVTEKDSMIRQQGKIIEDFKIVETHETDRLHKIIEELKDQNIEDLHELYDIDKEELDRLKNIISARDLSIKAFATICQSSGTARNQLEATVREQATELYSIKSDRDIMFQNYRNTIAKLQDDIEGLKAELSEWRGGGSRTIHLQKMRIDEQKQTIEKLKDDSEVLTRVVNVVRNWDDSTGRAFPTLIKILDELVDYTDATEGPPEPNIDDLYRVSVFLEMP